MNTQNTLQLTHSERTNQTAKTDNLCVTGKKALDEHLLFTFWLPLEHGASMNLPFQFNFLTWDSR
jgi:hypothetical protein